MQQQPVLLSTLAYTTVRARDRAIPTSKFPYLLRLPHGFTTLLVVANGLNVDG